MPSQLNPELPGLSPLVENIEDWFGQSEHSLHRARNEIRVVEFQGESFAVKAFRVPNPLHSFIYRYLRQSKAKRSYLYSLRLGSEFCPQPVAWIESHTPYGLGRSYYVSRHFDHDFTIRPVLRTADFAERTRILEDFARFTFALHEKGVLHMDYSPGNILIRHRDGKTDFRIVDVNRMRFGQLDLDQRLGNFSRLNPDDATLQILMGVYAELLCKPADKILQRAMQLRDAYVTARARSQAVKNRIRARNN